MKTFVAAVSFLAAAGSVAASMHKRINHDESRLTWFNLPSGNDACGHTLTEGTMAVHVPKNMWRNGQNCNQWVSMTVNGQQQYGMVTGYCDGCDNTDIDVSPAMFSAWEDPDVGVMKCTWKFMKMGYTPDLEECE